MAKQSIILEIKNLTPAPSPVPGKTAKLVPVSAGTGAGKPKPILIAPGQTVKITVSDLLRWLAEPAA